MMLLSRLYYDSRSFYTTGGEALQVPGSRALFGHLSVEILNAPNVIFTDFKDPDILLIPA